MTFNGLFFWTGVIVWGVLAGGTVIIIFALIQNHIAQGFKKNRNRK